MSTTESPIQPGLGLQIRSAYLELLKKSLLNVIYEDPIIQEAPLPLWKSKVLRRLFGKTARVFKVESFDKEKRSNGLDWPAFAHTMIGNKRINNLQACLETVITEKIKGDFIETGVWRGGASIFAKGVFFAYGQTDRNVWLADSFEGLPKPNAVNYPDDEGDEHFKYDFLRVGIDEVTENFKKYGLLDERVVFVKGWFKDTLPTLNIGPIAVLRLDGDMYESTIVALESLYHRLSDGGFIIVDDYCIKSCSKAVSDFRSKHSITEPIIEIDGIGVYWRKKLPF
jgi:O-methyltransferase